MRFIYLTLTLFILASSALVLADERSNEPNWCFEGQRWGDGRCNNADPYINDYNWRMGWLMAHCELGLLPMEICSQPNKSAIFGGNESSVWNGYFVYTLSASNINSELPPELEAPSFYIGS